MDEENIRLIRKQLRSPRSAAFAGILFSVLMFVSIALMSNVTEVLPEDINRQWLESWSGTASAVLTMVPFAGIAFLWFTGVIRDWLGDREDRFFATIFLGSSIVLVAMMFVWAAIVGAIFGSYTAYLLVNDDVIIFGFKLMSEIIGNYVVLMAGVFMLSIGSLWIRTGAAPRWLTVITYIVALGFLIFAGSAGEARFIFPGWVFLVSVYILILNYRMDIEERARRQG
ncbi:MAG: hypothetical protein JSW55_06745 [Chloroflexota bacterium]|nr:MAG: hypothetical protein JSW55_06745 [Chloroflexota bacterium]